MGGPGAICEDAATRASLRSAGWDYLLPVILINAPHLDKSKSKRHASVFTKFHALCLPYERVLLLDVDLLPRRGTNLGALFKVAAPAGKYHCTTYSGPMPEHNGLIPDSLIDSHWWCPNAGVLRLDPPSTRKEREQLLVQIVQELCEWGCATYLPEQYYLAQRFGAWRHIGLNWNWEASFEWGVPRASASVEEAVKESRERGWSIYSGADGDQVRRDVLVWHFSGTRDTQPWLFLDFDTAE